MPLHPVVTTDQAAHTVPAYVNANHSPNETIRFSERAVALTEQYAYMNFAVYRLADIAGSSVRKQTLDYKVIFVIAAIGTVSAAIACASSIAIALLILGVCWLVALALYLSSPSTYILQLDLPDGKRDALMARDRAYLMRVARALERARVEHHPSKPLLASVS